MGRTQGHPRICSLRGLLVEPSSLALCWTLSQESRTQLKQALGPAHHGHLTVVRVCPAVGHCEQNGLRSTCVTVLLPQGLLGSRWALICIPARFTPPPQTPGKHRHTGCVLQNSASDVSPKLPGKCWGSDFQMFYRSNNISLKKLCGLLHQGGRWDLKAEFSAFASWLLGKVTQRVSGRGSSQVRDLLTCVCWEPFLWF